MLYATPYALELPTVPVLNSQTLVSLASQCTAVHLRFLYKIVLTVIHNLLVWLNFINFGNIMLLYGFAVHCSLKVTAYSC
jgi:hypothetical protein